MTYNVLRDLLLDKDFQDLTVREFVAKLNEADDRLMKLDEETLKIPKGFQTPNDGTYYDFK